MCIPLPFIRKTTFVPATFLIALSIVKLKVAIKPDQAKIILNECGLSLLICYCFFFQLQVASCQMFTLKRSRSVSSIFGYTV